ncbi:MAG TPA: rod shape-determining protein RodA [Kiritimatiellia bacterium]|nr:rod shape-determining protein RodA [Kiritimatiellia bacterium]HRZ12603.1 rod shape-determining protein RodA [Kiritimatiellia bacterium]HSA17681.1 rod shape-determining protein RodA [Kiritimatiellia bacterium]
MDWTTAKWLLKRMDWFLALAVLLLLGTGIAFVYSASYRGDDLPVPGFYRRQMLWAALGVAVFLAFMLTDYRRLRAAAGWFYGVSLVLLVLVLVMGKKVYGAYRWLSVFGVQVQPSEFAKLALIIMLARFLGRPGRDLQHPGTLVRALILLAVPFALIVKEPDLGTAMILVPVTALMLFVAGTPLRQLFVLGLVGLMLAPLGWLAMDDYQKERVHVFLNPGRDPLGAGWNKIQSEIAVGSGKLWGKGWLEGKQNVLGFLPRTVAPTDFVYSVIAEEKGFVGSAILLSLYAVVLGGGIRAAVEARDRAGRLMAVGMTGLLFSQVFVNIAMTIGLLPIAGLPLPLISYGGSSMLTTLAGLGITQSVYTRRYSL